MTKPTTSKAGERTLTITIGQVRQSGREFFVDIFHTVNGGGFCADAYKYGHNSFPTRAAAQAFRDQSVTR